MRTYSCASLLLCPKKTPKCLEDKSKEEITFVCGGDVLGEVFGVCQGEVFPYS